MAASLGLAQAIAYVSPVSRSTEGPVFFLVWLSAAVTWFSSAECAAWWRSTAAWPSTGGLPDWRMGFADLTAAPDGLPRPRGHCWQLLRLFRQLD